MINSKRRFNRGVVAAQFAALCFVSSSALAAIVDSGPVSIVIPDDGDGIYVNVVTGAAAAPTAPAGWDIDPYSSPAGSFNLWGPTTNTWFNPQGLITGNYNLPIGTVIQGAATAFFRPAGANPVTAQVTLNSSQNYFGFRFQNEANANANHFGFMQVQFGATAATRTIIRYVYDNVADTAVTVTTGGAVATAPQFAYTPAAGSTVGFTGGAAIGSTGSASISAAVGTAGSGTGATATTTTTCTAPTAPFAGFGQTITAEGTGAISGGPLSGTCVLGAAAATQTLTCSESRGGTATPVTFTLSCPAGAQANLTPTPTSGSTITLSRVLGGLAATGQVSFQNPGAAAATVTCTAPANTAFTASPLVVNVPAGGSASTTVSYTSATAGSQTGTLTCSSGAQQFTYNLSGVTGLPTAEIIPASSTWTLALLATLMSLLAGVFVMRRQD